MKPKVSIIIPVHNEEKLLSRCLESVLNQTISDIELLCVNNGSNDRSGEILTSYALLDRRIRVFEEKQGDLALARNIGLKHATAGYIGFVDSDDWIEKETYEVALKGMESGVDLITWGAKIINEGGFSAETMLAPQRYHQIQLTGKHAANPQTLRKLPVTVWNKLFRKNIIDSFAISFPFKRRFEDNLFFLKYFLHSNSILCIDKYLYNYVQRKNSIMDTSRAKTKDSHFTDRLWLSSEICDYTKKHNYIQTYASWQSERFDWNFSTDFSEAPESLKNNVLNYAASVARHLKSHGISSNTVNSLASEAFHTLPVVMDEAISQPGVKTLSQNHKQSFIKNKMLERINTSLNSFAASFSDTTRNFSNIQALSNGNCNSEISNILKSLGFFYFIPNSGNMGDVLIAEAEYQLFDNLKLEYKTYSSLSQGFPLNSPFSLVYGGGDIFTNHWNYQHILTFFKNKNLQRCIILPSSFSHCPDVIDCLDERFIVFCREKNSYKYCTQNNKRAHFLLSDDMALHTDLSKVFKIDYKQAKENRENLPSEVQLYVSYILWDKYKQTALKLQSSLQKHTVILDNKRLGYFMRTDAEKKQHYRCQTNFDISVILNSSSANRGITGLITSLFIDSINSVDIVATDSLHIGIMAVLLKKQLFWFDNSYGKISGVFEQSLKDNKKITFTSVINEKTIEKDSSIDRTANLKIFDNDYLHFPYFLYYYLGNSYLNSITALTDNEWGVNT